MHTIEWVRAHALDVALYLACATVVARVAYAFVARLVAPYPRLRAAVEALAAGSPDLLRGFAQLYRVVTGIDLPLPMIDARDAEIARLRAALAVAQGDLMALRATRVAPPAPVDPQAGHLRAGLLGVVLLVAAAGFALRCRPATDAGYAVAGLPAASQCSARSYRCASGIPEVCASAGGALRWWPTVPPGPDGRRVPCARCVVDADGGVAHCDNASADGGAP